MLTRDTGESDSSRLLLLADLRELFDSEASDVLFTSEILKALHARDNRPWPEYRNGKSITGRQIAAQLKPLGITTNQTVRRGEATEKGYRREWFDDAFARYLPSQSVTRSQVTDSAAFGHSLSVRPRQNVTDTSRKNPSVSAGCDRVTDRNPLLWWRDDHDWPEPGPEEATWTE